MRDVTALEPGRHAAPVDQAEAILWHSHITYSASWLIVLQDDIPVDTVPEEARIWMVAARRVLKDVISHG